MPRAKSISARNHRKTLKAVKGFRHAARRRIRAAKEAELHAGAYAFHGRKLRKRDMRSLWIVRLNAAAREHDLSYSKMMKGLKDAHIEINRKMLSEIAINDPEAFNQIISTAFASK